MIQVSDENRNQWKIKSWFASGKITEPFGDLVFLSRSWTMTFLKKKKINVILNFGTKLLGLCPSLSDLSFLRYSRHYLIQDTEE